MTNILHYRKKYNHQKKSHTEAVRMDLDDHQKINKLSKQLKLTKSALIRQALYDLFNKNSIK